MFFGYPIILLVFAAAIFASYRAFAALKKLSGPRPDPDHVIAAISVEELEILNDFRDKQGLRPVVFTRQYPEFRVAPAATHKRMRKRNRSFVGIKGPIVPVCQLCPVCKRMSILHVMPNAMKANCMVCGIIDLDVAAAEMRATMRQVEWQ